VHRYPLIRYSTVVTSSTATTSTQGKGYESHVAAALAAQVTMTFIANPTTDLGVVFTVGNITLTGVIATPVGAQFQLLSTLALTLADLVAKFNAQAGKDTTARVNGGTVVFVANAVGIAGDLLVATHTTDTDNRYSFSGATLSGGRAIVTGTPGHAPNHFFAGVLEVDSAAYLDSSLTIAGMGVFVPSATTNVVAATGITAAMIAYGELIVQSSLAGDTTISSTPRIAAGVAGQRLLLHGASDTKTVTLTIGTSSALKLAGGAPMVLGLDDFILLVYSSLGSCWCEQYRSNN
jgi:hypothetical protein